MKQCPLHILQDCNSNCALYDEVTENCSISLGADALCFLADSLAKEIKDNKTIANQNKFAMTVKHFFELQEELNALYKVQLVIEVSTYCYSFDYDEIRLTSYLEFKKFIEEEFNNPQKILDTAILTNSGYFRFVGLNGWNEIPFHIEVLENKK